MRIGIIIPDRGDRPRFLANCFRMLNAQTVQPTLVELVDFVASDNECDITKRYRIGYDKLRNKALDIILFWENDDWYSPTYIETMINKWIEFGKPDLFGTTYTIYYHIKEFGYFPMNHHQRCSAMSTLIKPDLNFEWCPDNEPFTDSHLWNLTTITKKLFTPVKPVSMGIKHGVGLTGGEMHVNRLYRFTTNTGTKDIDKKFLKETLDEKSFEFYANYFYSINNG